MAKEKTNNAPETLEDALVIIEHLNAELTASNEVAEAAKKAAEEMSAELDAIKANHAAQLDAVQEKVQEITKSVPGTYKSKKHNVTIRFKDGFVKTRVKDVIIPSAELLKNKGGDFTDFLDNLIAIEYGGIEILK